MLKNRKSIYIISCFILATVFTPIATASVYYHLKFQVYIPPVGEADVRFTNGNDTNLIGGIIQKNGSEFIISDLPIFASVGVFITEAVNLTNFDSSSHYINLKLNYENFTSDVANLTIWMVENDGTHNIAIGIDNFGAVTTSESGSVLIQAGESFAIKIYVEMDVDDNTDDSYKLDLLFEVIS